MAAAAAAAAAAGAGGAAGPGTGPGGGPGAGGPGPGPPGLEAAIQKLALRRKKVLNAEETELYELALAAGGAIDPDVFKILVDLLKLNVAPLAVFQMLKSMCAGQRLATEAPGPEGMGSALPPSALPEAREGKTGAGPAGPCFSSGPRPSPRQAAAAATQTGLGSPAAVGSPLPHRAPGRNKSSGTAVLGERGGREGSSQRMPRQPSASRLPKGGTGKSPTRSSN
ncbi:mitotic-spindle organizing protein 2B-like isoform X2 [Antechinus flavipes]|uniref:mitotic-spindle organizing protein 2B-like isoform X2 n=1 Tax=Antechinus flavipes TaxID=38775 RepID=UPI00223647CE|nr:mitotic-spindle organizing protein 2B-like isoform X2 [Antechinus flavipes]